MRFSHQSDACDLWGVGVSVAWRGVLTRQGRFSPRKLFPEAGPHVITYRATLDVPAETVREVAGWLSAHRKAHDRAPCSVRRPRSCRPS